MQSVSDTLSRLPIEMQQRSQWCIAGPDKAPYLIGNNGLFHASPVNGPWLDFNTACQYAVQHGVGIGYIITADDGLTCIDMDIKDAESLDGNGNPVPQEQWTSQHGLDHYIGITKFANSYTELSASGKGLHTWVFGDIGAGRKGKGLEVYSKERFIICTGNHVSDFVYHKLNGVVIPHVNAREYKPVADGTLIIQSLANDLKTQAADIQLVEVEAKFTDTEIWHRARTASNGAKFRYLCEGDMTNFPSQSEADLALMSMFTFYSDSNSQCIRMFRQTALGVRNKAVKNDVYLNRTLRIIRTRQEKSKAVQEHGAMLAEALMIKNKAKEDKIDLNVKEYVQQVVPQQQHSLSKPFIVTEQPPEVPGLEWPPGFVGAVASFIYNSAPRPVKEVAIVAALGLMAGITGKAYNIQQTGINLYIILIARSAIGKEAMHSGIGHILNSTCGQHIKNFVDYSDYVSGPALMKGFASETSFVNVSGEWGHKLRRMADNRDSAMGSLRTVMTNVYQKSGAGSVVGGNAYSKEENNVETVKAVAYSMIGETTPGTFYDSLTASMMEDGFLSRFNIIEYKGERPPANKHTVKLFPTNMADYLADVGRHALGITRNPGAAVIEVAFTADAKQMVDDFDIEVDDKINAAAEEEPIRQIWNRAHIKVLRISGVLAASDNYLAPLIERHHVAWAINMVMSDADAMLGKIEGGEIGETDTDRFRKVINILDAFVKGQIKLKDKDLTMQKDNIITRRLLQSKTSGIRCFRDYRMGSTMALDHTLRSAIDNNYLIECESSSVVEMHGYHGKCYRIIDTDLS